MIQGWLMNNETDPDRNHLNVKSDSARSLLEIAVLATAVAGLLYFGYFQLAPWIWSQNLPFKPEDITPWILPLLKNEERDGIELYALYVLMFLDLFLVYSLSSAWHRLAPKPMRYFFVLSLLVAFAFIGSIGFHPPINTFADRSASDIFARMVTVMIVIVPIITLLYYLQHRSTYWAMTVAALLLIPVCFISTSPLSWFDYVYILAPSLRLYHGANVSEIYFQYDLLLSLIGLAWLKLRLDLNTFQVVGQCSYYLLLLVVYAFSRRLFIDKRLPVFLLIATVLVRIYAGMHDDFLAFQVTPLRLDLWLILLMLVYFKGTYHWSASLFCGLLLLFHKSFGIIYSVAYIQLLLTLCVIDTAMIPGKLIETAASALKTFIKKNYRNLTILLAGSLAQHLLFRNANVQSDFSIVNLGIGFFRITTHSFYWYIVVVSGMAFVLLLRLRSMVSSNYLAAGFCLIYLVIGNSLYFFGRSHENNIINISAILLLLFFLLIDLANHFLGNTSSEAIKPFYHRNLTIIVSLAFIASIIIWYGDSITDKVAIQVRNAGKGQFIYPSGVPEQDVLKSIAEVKSVTGDNPKVYFVNRYDFIYDYYGGYAPVGYYNPHDAWISRREFNKFLQGLLDDGYYLVMGNDVAQDVLPSVWFSNKKFIGKHALVAWK
jgi:hypothetical protein